VSFKKTFWDKFSPRKEVARQMKRLRMGWTYFMGTRFPASEWTRKPPLKDIFIGRRQQLRQLMLDGKAEDAALMLAENPDLLPFFSRTLTKEVHKIRERPTLFRLEAVICLSGAAADPDMADRTVRMLGQMLDCDDRQASKLAVESLRSAIRDNGGDVSLAVGGLEKALSEYDLAQDATIALTYQYMRDRDQAKLMGFVRHPDETIRTWSQKVVSIKAANGDMFAVSALLEGCADDDTAVRQLSARNLASALFTADPETKRAIREGFQMFRKGNDLVHLDVLREMNEVEKILASGGKEYG
jgi:hypothetical protein